MNRCKNADRYKGLRLPTCNKGNPCRACRRIYHHAQARRLETLRSVREVE